MHNTTPNHLHGPVIVAALAHGKHVDLGQAAGQDRRGSAPAAAMLAHGAGVVHAVTFNYRGNPLVQQARAMIAARRASATSHFVHGAVSAGLAAQPTDFSWRLEPEQGRRQLRRRRHRIALVRPRPACHRAADRRGARRPDDRRGDPQQAGRRRPRRSRAPTPTAVSRSGSRAKTWPAVLLRFDGGAKGSVTIGQVCAGHKNDLWFEVNGRQASLRWRQEQQNELWIGRRDAANCVLAKDPSLLAPGARDYAHLPGGHQEGWSRRVPQRPAPTSTRRSSSRRRRGWVTAAAGRRVCDVRGRLSGMRRRRGAREPSSRRPVDDGAASSWERRDEARSVHPRVRQPWRRRRCSRRCGRCRRSRRSSSAPAAGRARSHIDVDGLLGDAKAIDDSAGRLPTPA